VCQS